MQHATVICSPVHQNPRKCSVVCNEGYSFDENSHGSRGNYTSSEEGVVMFSCPLNDVDEIELPQCSGKFVFVFSEIKSVMYSTYLGGPLLCNRSCAAKQYIHRR